jgi:outer membrane receptor protein involved in Fe transport
MPSRLWIQLLVLQGFACGLAHAEPDDAAAELEAVLAQPVYGSSRFAGASKYDQDAVRAPATVYVRTAGEIRAHGYRTLAEVLESIPGFHLRNDRVYTYAGVRGFNLPGDYSSRLLLLVDGARINDALYDAALPGREFLIDVDLIDRVEVIAGPGSSLYGSNAVLCVVNVITRNPSQLPGWTAGAELGSGAGRKLGATWGGELGNARALLGASSERRPGRDLYFPEYDAPETLHGVAAGRDSEAVDKLFAKLRLADFSLLAALTDRTKGVPTGSYGAVFGTPNDWTDRMALADLSFGRRLDAQQEVHMRLGVAQYDYLAVGDYGTPEAPDIYDSRSTARWVSGEARHLWLGWSGHRVLTGVEFQHNARLEFMPEGIRAHTQRRALFVNDEWQALPQVTLNLGLRVDHRLDGRDTVSPRLAALWSPSPRWTWKWLQGQAFREPNLYETAFADDTQKANPSVQVESLRSRELAGVWRASDAWTWSAALYTIRLRDLIELVPQQDGLNMFENRGTAQSRGVELEGTYVSAAGLQWRTSWSRQQVRNPSTAQVPADAPRSLLKLLLTTPGPWPGATLAADAVRVGERLTLARTALPACTRINLHVTHAPLRQRWTLGAGVYNLADRACSDPAGPEHLQDSLARDPRELRARVSWAF